MKPTKITEIWHPNLHPTVAIPWSPRAIFGTASRAIFGSLPGRFSRPLPGRFSYRLPGGFHNGNWEQRTSSPEHLQDDFRIASRAISGSPSRRFLIQLPGRIFDRFLHGVTTVGCKFGCQIWLRFCTGQKTGVGRDRAWRHVCLEKLEPQCDILHLQNVTESRGPT